MTTLPYVLATPPPYFPHGVTSINVPHPHHYVYVAANNPLLLSPLQIANIITIIVRQVLDAKINDEFCIIIIIMDGTHL